MTTLAPRRYAVIGADTRGSLSPAIHHHFARATQKPVVYAAFSASEKDFDGAVAAFWEKSGRGLNVTVPFKGRAKRHASKVSAMVKKTGVLNVLHKDAEGAVCGYNTDGAGFVADLRKVAGGRLDGCRMLLVGAGGAAAGVLPALQKQGMSHLFVANRTASKARELAGWLSEKTGTAVAGGGFDEATGPFDVVVNATSAGHGGNAPDLDGRLFKGARLAYDMNYGPAAASFLRSARKHGVGRHADGLGMLVEQAALSFAVWEGVRPSTAGLAQSLAAWLSREGGET